MATRIAAQNLTVGGSASGTAWAPTPEKLTITFVATQVVADSVVRCLILDAGSRVLASTVLNGTSTKKLSVEGLETNVNVRMEQLQGSAQVTCSDGTGGDITADEIATGAVGAAEILDGAVAVADLADGALAASAAGRAKIADDFFTAAEFAAGAGGKFAANALVAAGVANLFGDDAFTAANMAKFATDAITAAVAADIIQDAAIATAHLEAGCATLPKVDFTGLKLLTADGANAAGSAQAVTLTGAAVGDRVVAIFGVVKADHAGAWLLPAIGSVFESTISIVDQIQQLTTDHSNDTFIFILAPAQA